VTATPRSGEGHDVAPDGSGRPDCMDLHDGGQQSTVLYKPRALGQRSRHISVALSVGLLYVLVDIFVKGPLTSLDEAFYKWHPRESIPALHRWAWFYDKFGQRSVLLPILLVVAGVVARRRRTWRPLLLAFTSFFILNLVVGAMKVIIGRSQTETGNPSVLNHGIIFPSGHSSNMVLTGGVLIYLLVRYGEHPPVRWVVAVWTALTLLTISTSLYLGTHWISDLLGGVLVGGLLLQAVIVFDRKTANVREDPPAILAPALRLGLFESHADRVDAVPVTGGGLGGVVEEVPEVRPAPPAPDLRTTHAE
jgi:membrane-associated phospholipid phosphatase